ncbi:hypothetical protein [Luteimonas kalidii]|uniref:Glycosyltransferase n=1 Tax=Luteimonas kalidii TaxID=3042025 RepID=A0ABT6JXL4_9GAMM|nr:hypothetical protein [Luteimonas kalidii]MDH5835444.1 hypothetical protein [Luteimonas kalidii]
MAAAAGVDASQDVEDHPLNPDVERPADLPARPDPDEGRARIRKFESALADERARNAALVVEREGLLRSRSWRVTAPLRWAMSRLAPRGVDSTPGDPGEGAYAGAGGLAPGLLRPQKGDIESDNATFRLLDFGAGLEGVVNDRVLDILRAPSPAEIPGYLGWKAAPPTIAFIGSPDLQLDLAFDARVLALKDDDWESTLSRERPRFLLIEPVWHVEHRHWRYALTRDGRKESLLRLLEHCRQVGIRVVVWYRDTIANLAQFAWLAEHADLLCAADSATAAALANATRHPVEYLPPAIQPALHNRLRGPGLQLAAASLSDRITFDGWWDLQGERLHELPVLRRLQQHRLLVAESRWEFGRIRLADSPEFRRYVVGCLDRHDRLALNRVQGAEVFANEPIAGRSHSVQRMLQAAACGSIVARLDGNQAVLDEFGLPVLDQGGGEPVDALAALLSDPLAAERWRHRSWRGLMHSHTVAHRLQRISSLLGDTDAGFQADEPKIACLLATMRPERLQDCIERFRRDAYPAKELVVVVHGDSIPRRDLTSMVREGEAITFLEMGSNCSLGACLNFAAAHTDAPYWTKVDDDDLYGREYLGDIMLYQRTGDHAVFGKSPMFNYLERVDELLWDPQWAHYANHVHEAIRSRTALVAGGTLGGKAQVLRDIPFSERRRGGSDSDFILRCHDAGLDVLSMDGFNFVRYRSGQAGFHTWQMAEDEARHRSRVVGTRDALGIALLGDSP